MSDIELVVKISEDEYVNIKNAINNLIAQGVEHSSMSKVCLAILNGTPLPKGHGRLIDADELHHKMGEWLKPQKADESVMVALDDIAISTMMEIEDAPTIIEADKEVEE